MSKILNYPVFRENLYMDESGNYTKKFESILFLMRVTGISRLQSLVDVYNMVLRIKMVTSIIHEKLNKNVSTHEALIALNVDGNRILISLKDLIDHMDVEMVNVDIQSITSYSKNPVGSWGAVIMSGNNGMWSSMYSHKTYIDDCGTKLCLPPFVLLAPGRGIYPQCRQWAVRELALS